MSKTDNEKEDIISEIEYESRNGNAFDDKIVTVLKKLKVSDLFLIQLAFYQSYKYGKESEQE